VAPSSRLFVVGFSANDVFFCQVGLLSGFGAVGANCDSDRVNSLKKINDKGGSDRGAVQRRLVQRLAADSMTLA